MNMNWTFGRRAAVAAAGAVIVAGPLVASTSAAWTATITNDTNTIATAAVVLEEQQTDSSWVSAGLTKNCVSSSNANNDATCSSVNKYGGVANVTPGTTTDTYLTLKNTGSASASLLSLTALNCTKTTNGTAFVGSGDLCDKLQVTVTVDGTDVVVAQTPNQMKTATATTPYTIKTSLPAGQLVKVRVRVYFDSNADNTFMGLQASQPLKWQLTA